MFLKSIRVFCNSFSLFFSFITFHCFIIHITYSFLASSILVFIIANLFWISYCSLHFWLIYTTFISVGRTSLKSSILFSSSSTLMVVALNSPEGILTIYVLLILLFHLEWSPLSWYFVYISLFVSVLEKLAIFPAPDTNGFMKKRSCSVQWLEVQGVSLVCALCTLLLCFGCSILQATCLQRFYLPTVDNICSLARVWGDLTRCALVCLLNATWYYSNATEAFQNSGQEKC